jgi:tetratricopeptide (TPR) repeat protein
MSHDKKQNPESADELSRQGQHRLKEGRYEDAIASFTAAADLYARQGDAKDQAVHLQMAADICQLIKEVDRALEIYKEVLGLYAGLNMQTPRARILNNIGLLQARRDNYDEALVHFREALGIFEELEESMHVAEQWGNIGSVYRDMKKYENAMESYNCALPIFEKLGYREGVADQYTNIAYVHVMREQFEQALDWYEKALSIYMEEGSEKKTEFTKRNIDNLKSDSGEENA